LNRRKRSGCREPDPDAEFLPELAGLDETVPLLFAKPRSGQAAAALVHDKQSLPGMSANFDL
jgi:hypothetical protein